MQTTSTDLIFDECPFGCDHCPEIWINHQIGHSIICRCTRCRHSKKLSTHQNELEIEGADSND